MQKYRNIPAKIRSDVEVKEHLYSKLKVDKENQAKLSESFIKKFGKCWIPINPQKSTKYQTTGLYKFYKKHGKVLSNTTNNHYQFYNHRIMYSIHNLSKTLNHESKQVHHICCNPRCCSRKHLQLIDTNTNQLEKLTRVFDLLKIEFDDPSSHAHKMMKIGFDGVDNSGIDFDSGDYKRDNSLDCEWWNEF